MAKHVLLNNIEHKQLRIITERSKELGDNLWVTQIFPQEFRIAQSCYPIFFQKDTQTGSFFAVTLFGFEQHENLYLTDKGWDALYIPMMVQRHPFSIGRQRILEQGDEKSKLVVNIDIESARVSQDKGTPLFDQFGNNTDYLERVVDILHSIHQSVPDSEQFIEALLKFDLLETFVMSVTLQNGTVNELIGFYTINEEKLNQLSGEALVELHNKKYLETIYMVLSSHAHINYLIEQKNKKYQLDECKN
jgi:SapC